MKQLRLAFELLRFSCVALDLLQNVAEIARTYLRFLFVQTILQLRICLCRLQSP